MRVRLAADEITAVFALDGRFGEGNLLLPLDVLSAVQGAGDETIELNAPEPAKIVVRWTDAGVPQSVSLDVPEPKEEAGSPAQPTTWESNSEELAACLRETAKVVAKDGTRFALHRICLRGSQGEVLGTDGRQLLRCGGFHFPWTEDVLIPALPVLAATELQEMSSWSVGKATDLVMLRSGPWTLSVGTDKNGRFPDVEQVIPRSLGDGSTWRIAPNDAEFLARTLPRLPGKDDDSHPVTVDLNGQVCVRARAADQPQATEVVLTRSGYSGQPVKLACDRQYLLRAMQMGMTEARIEGPDRPVVFEKEKRLYLFMPLPSKSALAHDDGATRLESALPSHPQPPRRVRPMELKTDSPQPATIKKPSAKPTPRPDGGAGLLAESQALRDHLREGFRQANELLRSIKRHRRQSKLVASTLASLRQLQTIGH